MHKYGDVHTRGAHSEGITQSRDTPCSQTLTHGAAVENLSLPPPMRPWEPPHSYVTLVSPCPAKGLCVLLGLARRMASVAFAAMPTQVRHPLTPCVLFLSHAPSRPDSMRSSHSILLVSPISHTPCNNSVSSRLRFPPQLTFPILNPHMLSHRSSCSLQYVQYEYIFLPTPQWTDDASLARLADAPNVTLLEANADIDVILKRTRVLLAPSIWQECCVLVVMEAALRGNPNTLTLIP